MEQKVQTIYTKVFDLLQQYQSDNKEKLSLNLINVENDNYLKIKDITDHLNIECNNYDVKHIENLLKLIHNLNNDKNCHGVYINNLLNAMLEKQKSLIYAMITPGKDVSIINPVSVGLILHHNYVVLPPTIEVILNILNEYEINLINSKVLIIDNSNYIGSLLNIILNSKGCITISCDVNNDFDDYLLTNDIIIALADCDIKKINLQSIYINFSNSPGFNTKYYINKENIQYLLNIYIIYNFIRLYQFNNTKINESMINTGEVNC